MQKLLLLILISVCSPALASTEADCLAKNMFFEARSESVESQLAVAQVTLNRVADPRYPSTVCGVVWASKAFSWTHDGVHDDPTRMSYLDRAAWKEIQVRAKEVLKNGTGVEITSTHYLTVKARARWTKLYDFDGRVGSHLFYTNNTPYK